MTSDLPKKRTIGLPAWFEREPLSALRQEVDDLFSRFAGEAWGGRMPSLDLSETDKAVQIRMDIPGLKPEDIDIRVTNNSLSISGERKEDREEKGRSFHRIERHYGSFSRTVPLPCAVDAEKVHAAYKEGVLTIDLPKTAEAMSRKIGVKG